MKVSIKKFDVEMELKNNGVELDIYKPDGTYLGDLIVTKSNLIWCKGKTKRQNGIGQMGSIYRNNVKWRLNKPAMLTARSTIHRVPPSISTNTLPRTHFETS